MVKVIESERTNVILIFINLKTTFMKETIKKNLLLLLLLICGVVSLHAAPSRSERFVRTGYLTCALIREHDNDLPRTYYMMIDEDGEITPVWFFRCESNEPGKLHSNVFNPKDYLGKTITMDFEGVSTANNNEFVIYEDGKQKLINRIILSKIYSLEVVDKKIKVEKGLIYPLRDTLTVPHDVLVPKVRYADKVASNKVVQLTDYVKGDGTSDSPYTSADGSAGLLEAFAALPDGGTVEVAHGEYLSTTGMIQIPTFVNIRGMSEVKPVFHLTESDAWLVQGSNLIENVRLDLCNMSQPYVGQVLVIDNNARDVVVRGVEVQGGYTIDPTTYRSTNNVVAMRLMSYIDNITFDGCRFSNIMRGLVTKGQRSQHGITIKNCTFEGTGHMCVSFDQVSDITDVLLENNNFHEFTHFGTAFARISNVTIRNNRYYSRNKMSVNGYSQPIHMEESCQNFVIENNDIDVQMRQYDGAAPTSRNYGISVMDARNLKILNNRLTHCNVELDATHSWVGGNVLFSKNNIVDGQVNIGRGCNNVTVTYNYIENPPVQPFAIECMKLEFAPTHGHVIERNRVVGLEGKRSFIIEGHVKDCIIKDNLFIGEGQLPYHIEVSDLGGDITVEGNTFTGLAE